MFVSNAAVALEPAILASSCETVDGRFILTRLLDVANHYVRQLQALATARGVAAPRLALLGRVRGTGPGVSFSGLVTALKHTFPLPLQSPFEDSFNVAGAVLEARSLIAAHRDDALMILRFDAGATDLPMHAHEDSDRLLYVAKGRGFFHVSSQEVGEFNGEDVCSMAVRERDIVLFSRGTVHTFSTRDEPLELLSYHAPYVPLTDPRQYVLPEYRLCPGDSIDVPPAKILCDAAWNRLV